MGYPVYWEQENLRIHRDVTPPTLVPVKAGDRVKTDRRATEKLARCYRAGDLTPVWVPDPAHEALRGIANVSAATIVAEVGQLSRFTQPGQLMGYGGAVPHEDSSGDRVRRGSSPLRPARGQTEPETAVARHDRTLLGTPLLDHAAEYDELLQRHDMEARREITKIAGALHPGRRAPHPRGAGVARADRRRARQRQHRHRGRRSHFAERRLDLGRRELP